MVSRATLFFFTLVIVSGSSFAAEMSEPLVALEGSKVLLTFELRGAFDDRFVERVESGLPTSIVYSFRLQRDHRRWFDRGIAESRLTVVGMYDAVRREYLVNSKLDGRLITSRTVTDLKALEREMTRFERIHVFNLEPLAEGRRLVVRTRAELGAKTVLWFVPTTVTTNWQESRRFRVPPTAQAGKR